MAGVALCNGAGGPVARGGVPVGVAQHLRAPEAGRRPRAAVPPPTVRLDGQPAAGLPGDAPVGHDVGGRSDRTHGRAGPEFGGGGAAGAPGADRTARCGTLDAPPPAARAGVLGVAAHAGAGPVRGGGTDLGRVRRGARHGRRAGAVTDGRRGAPRHAADPGSLPHGTQEGGPGGMREDGPGRIGEEAT